MQYLYQLVANPGLLYPAAGCVNTREANNYEHRYQEAEIEAGENRYNGKQLLYDSCQCVVLPSAEHASCLNRGVTTS